MADPVSGCHPHDRLPQAAGPKPQPSWKALAVAGALGLAGWALPSAALRADGCFVARQPWPLVEPAQQALLGFSGRHEVLVLKVRYEGPAQAFAWLVPLPSKPKVEALAPDQDPFQELQALFRQHGRAQLPSNAVPPAQGGSGGAPDVLRLEGGRVGPFIYAVLAAHSAGALRDWLRLNGYVPPVGAQRVLDAYAAQGWTFTAFKFSPGTDRAAGQAGAELPPIRFAFGAAAPVYPLRVSSVNRGMGQLQVYCVGASALRPRGPLLADLCWQPHPGLWPTDTVHAYRFGPANLPATLDALRGLGLSSGVVERWQGYVLPEEMSQDLVMEPFDDPDAVAVDEPWRADPAAGEGPGRDLWAGNADGRDAWLLKSGNVDPEDLDRLGAVGPRLAVAVVQAPGASLGLIRRLMAQGGEAVRAAAAEASGDAGLLEGLARDPAAAVRSRVARNLRCPSAVLVALSGDADHGVASAAMSNPGLPLDRCRALLEPQAAPLDLALLALIRLKPLGAVDQRLYARHPEAAVRARVAAQADLDASAAVTLADDASAWVRQALAENPGIPLTLLQRLGRDPDAKARAIAQLKLKDLDTVRRVMRSPDKNLRVQAAADDASGHFSQGDWERLAGDREPVVRARVAGNPSAPAGIVQALAADPQPLVRQAAARNPHCPPALRQRLAADPEGAVRASLAGNEALSAEEQAALSRDADGLVRAGLARRSGLALEAASRLASDDAAWVRAILAANPACGGACRATLAQGQDAGVREALIRNPGLSADELACLAQDPSDAVRRALAGRGGLDPALELALAHDQAWPVRLALAESAGAAMPHAAALALARDPDPEIRQMARRWLFAGERALAGPLTH